MVNQTEIEFTEGFFKISSKTVEEKKIKDFPGKKLKSIALSFYILELNFTTFRKGKNGTMVVLDAHLDNDTVWDHLQVGGAGGGQQCPAQ